VAGSRFRAVEVRNETLSFQATVKFASWTSTKYQLAPLAAVQVKTAPVDVGEAARLLGAPGRARMVVNEDVLENGPDPPAFDAPTRQ